MARHPDFPAEAAAVERLSGYALSLLREAREREDWQEKETRALRIAAGGGFDNALSVAETLLAALRSVVFNLTNAADKPCFSRIDFRDGEGLRQYYIGKWGVNDPQTLEPVIVDWRSPVADLYYSGRVGAASYAAPEGVIEGEMTLKRILTCEGGKLRTLAEADFVTQDACLSEALSGHAGRRLRDIVTTIQAEQNRVLRADRRKPLVVQGAPGTGKTSLALHRIAWLLYTYQNTMAPGNLMVLAPNPLFLNYISAVLPDLGVENVLQTTLHGLAEKLCGRALPPQTDGDIFQRLLDPQTPAQEKAVLERVSRFKGSVAFRRTLEAYVKWLSASLLPEGDVMLSGLRLYARKELAKVFLEDLRPFPLSARRDELEKHLRQRVEQGRLALRRAIDRQTDKRTALLRELHPENDRPRQARMGKIYDARNARRRELDTLSKGYADAFFDGWRKLDLMECYEEFAAEEPVFSLPPDVEPGLWRETAASIRRNLRKRQLDHGDVPALLLLQKALFGFAERLDIHHTVIDEAQDLPPLAYAVLMDLCHNASFTIVGDIAQGIHGYRGTRDWSLLTGEIFAGKSCAYYELVTGYRGTRQIMEFAGRVIARHPVPGCSPAKPAPRQGEPPRLVRLGRDTPLHRAVAGEMARLIAAGCRSVAVVTKLPRDASELQWRLWEVTDIPARLLIDTDTEYAGGCVVMPAYLTKGLEFDGLILADADADTWPDDALTARLLYVCLTRPLHYLTLLYAGDLTRLVEEKQ